MLDYYADWSLADSSPWYGTVFKTGGVLSDQFATVSSSPTPRYGANAARFTVRSGDSSGDPNTERCEVLELNAKTYVGGGRERYYAWSSYFPSDWTAPHTNVDPTQNFGIILQCIDTNGAVVGGPAVAVSARQSNLDLRVRTGIFDVNTGLCAFRQDYSNVAPITTGVWRDYIMRVRWSARADGQITMWSKLATDADYAQTYDVSGIATLQSGPNADSVVWMKQGLYRNAEAFTNVVYHDMFRRGETFADVEPLALPGAVTWAPASNQEPNGGFETDAANWSTVTGCSAIARDTTRARTGAACGSLTATGAANSCGVGSPSAKITVSPGQVWAVKAAAYRLLHMPNYGRVELNWYDAGSTLIGVAAGPNTALGILGGWTDLKVVDIAPATAAKLDIRIRLLTNDGSLIPAGVCGSIDNVEIVQL